MKSQDDSREKKYDLLVLLDVTFKTEAYHYMCVSVLTNYFQYPDKNLTSLKIPTAISYEQTMDQNSVMVYGWWCNLWCYLVLNSGTKFSSPICSAGTLGTVALGLNM